MAFSFLTRKMDPLLQAGLFFGVAFLFMVLTKMADWLGMVEPEELFPWSIASALLLLFAVFNSMMSLNADNSARYWGRSMYAFIGLAFANGLAAWLFSGVPIGAAQSYRWIYIVITICLLVMLTMVNLMKKIVQFAEREEWTQPRKRW
ncbi:MAG: hypothetical protein EP344_18910 [Bacteroidetes bacterium]|nr:MAG: hypothetical protein EP344_18910 [Bacteroidota bacterium]